MYFFTHIKNFILLLIIQEIFYFAKSFFIFKKFLSTLNLKNYFVFFGLDIPEEGLQPKLVVYVFVSNQYQF
jgi:hypothetical protein